MNIRAKLFYCYVLFVVLYALTFIVPRSISSLRGMELSVAQYRIISLTVLIPLAFIWYTAFYGYDRLRTYHTAIAQSDDGVYTRLITTGIMILAFGLPITTLVSALTAITAEHQPHLLALATIIKNYVAMLFPLFGILYISRGARNLCLRAKQHLSYAGRNVLAIVFILITISFCYLVLTSSNLETIFHMPDWLILLTLVGPYTYTWYLGILAAYELHLYSRRAPGSIYRNAWNLLGSGIGAIIAMQIVLQYVSTATVGLTHLRLVRLLFVVYVLLMLMSTGYLLVAFGAKRLHKIEEV